AAQDSNSNDNQTPTIIKNTVTLNANAAPTIAAPDNLDIQENHNLVFTGANKITISDPDAGSDNVEVLVNTTNGTFTLATTNGLTINSGGNGQAAIDFT